MKKTYSKPALFAESFELAEHIAKCQGVSDYSSEVNPLHWSTNGCKFEFIGENGVTETLFTASSSCSVMYFGPSVPTTTNCYNVPLAGLTPFGS